MTSPMKDDGELFRLASLIGCEPENEERHRKQLLEYVQTEKAKAVLEGKHAAYMDIVTKAGNGATVRDYATHMAAEYNKALTQQGPTNAK